MKKFTLIIFLLVLTSGLVGCHGFWRHDGGHHGGDRHWSGYGGGRGGGHGGWGR
ncbi:MAG TPA: hypothetical protein VLK23_15510 [Thermodesulfobacteriota bacterium]|nr:hypothetical protein [Thermodesulfobacteriota bacterium]